MRVALFITCLNDALYPATGKATVALLERLGVAVGFPAGQTCCGQMHLNSGYRRQAEKLLRRFSAVFGGYEAVVTPSGSCAAMVREHYSRICADLSVRGQLAEDIRAVAARTYELSEFLIDVLEVEDVGACFPHRVAYHPACHSLRVLRLGDRPVRLLRRVAGLNLVDLPGADECCGFGGTFSMKNAAISTAMGIDKARSVINTSAEVLCALDSSCLTHIGGILSRERARVPTMHLAEILASTEGEPAMSSEAGWRGR